jgi:AraC-like DNA-binding protein
MTAHASRLTKRPTGASRARAATDAASNVRVLIEALGRLGYETDSLLHAAGLRRSDLDDPDGRIPCSAVGAVVGRAMHERPMKNLATRMAAQTPIGAFPLIDYLIVTTESVGQGLEQLARYYRLVEVPVNLHFGDDQDLIRVVYDGPPNPFGYEFGIALALLHLREETENRFRADYVSFAHCPDEVSEVERVLGCPVHEQASWNGWAMSRQAWSLPLRRRDPILRGVLERQANDMMGRLPAIGGAALEVRRALVSRVAGRDTRIEAVARALATSARSLQRQLAAEGCSYKELAEATRREAAEHYLADSSLPVGEVAYLLGYSEAAAFHRAFKRWTGATPQGFRHGRRLGS